MSSETADVRVAQQPQDQDNQGNQPADKPVFKPGNLDGTDADTAKLNMLDMYEQFAASHDPDEIKGLRLAAVVVASFAAKAIDADGKVPVATLTNDGSINFDAPNEAVTKPGGDPTERTRPDDDDSGNNPEGKVIKDDQGRVIEVDYPNGTSRKFGYGEDGKLNSITQPDGKTIILKDGKWINVPPPEQQGGAGGSGHPGKGGGAGGGAKPGHDGSSDNQVRPDGADGKPIPDQSDKIPDSVGKGLGDVFNSMNKGVDIVDPVVSEDGTFTYHTRDGNEVKVFTNGTSWIHDEKSGSYVNKDADGRVESIVSPNAEVQQFHYNEKGELDTYTHNGESFYLKDGKWQTADGKPAPISEIKVDDKGVVTYKNDKDGSIEKRPDGTQTITNANGSHQELDAKGNVTEFTSADGRVKRTYEYDENGKLKSVSDKNGNKFTDNGDGTWTDKDGNKVTNFKIESDGRLQYTDKDGHIVVQNTDGNTSTTTKTEEQLIKDAEYLHLAMYLPGFLSGPASSIIDKQLGDLSPADRIALQQVYEKKYGSKLTDDLVKEFGWDNVGKTLEGMEAANLMDHAARDLPPEERQEFLTNLNTFLDRAHKSGMSSEEIAKTLAATDRLFTATDGKVDAHLRHVLARQMMAFAANPSSIDQGSHLTCNITDVENITWTRNPSVAAQMVADMALNGEWTAPDGHKVTIPPQNFVPQEGSYDSTNSNERLFASQIFQATALTDWGSRQKPPIYYMQGQPDAQNSTGEYWTDKDGNLIMEKDKDGNDVPKGFHGWGDDQIVEELRRLNGDDSRYLVHKDGGGGDNITTFENEEQFRQALEKAKADGKMPIILVVAAGDPVFGGSAQPGKDGHGLNHVVVISDYNPVTGQVRVDNSWGDGNDQWVNLGNLYQATRP
ncbi:MAG: RHS repeat domain-containing protein [Candidatus Obscuribacterales bacterium]